jgi:hypothetical protein
MTIFGLPMESMSLPLGSIHQRIGIYIYKGPLLEEIYFLTKAVPMFVIMFRSSVHVPSTRKSCLHHYLGCNLYFRYFIQSCFP